MSIVMPSPTARATAFHRDYWRFVEQVRHHDLFRRWPTTLSQLAKSGPRGRARLATWREYACICRLDRLSGRGARQIESLIGGVCC